MTLEGEYTAYPARATSMTKRLADLVRERGIKRGTISLRIAQQVDAEIRVGDRLPIADAVFTVKP